VIGVGRSERFAVGTLQWFTQTRKALFEIDHAPQWIFEPRVGRALQLAKHFFAESGVFADEQRIHTGLQAAANQRFRAVVIGDGFHLEIV
jgi:hypothetical protein